MTEERLAVSGGGASAMRATMRAITQERYGTPEVLEMKGVTIPEPAEGQVRVRVVAASLNIYDWHMTTGMPYMARAQAGWRVPKNVIPGGDVAGIVDVVGGGVESLVPGDEVLGFIGSGAWAEYVCAPAHALVPKPEGVTFEDAAATPLAALTALEALRDVGGLRSGQRVLINGASGGVGTFAVQIAKTLGAQVTAVCSTGKVEMARSIGADHVIDYESEDFVATESGYHLFFDNVGDRPWSETSRVLAPGGVNVTITGPKHRMLGPFRRLLYRKLMSAFDSRSFSWFTAHARREDLEYLVGLVASRQVRPMIESTWALEKTPEALSYLGEGHALGKLVLTAMSA